MKTKKNISKKLDNIAYNAKLAVVTGYVYASAVVYWAKTGVWFTGA